MKKITLLLSLFVSFIGFSQVINEIDADQAGSDSAEFVELSWTPNTALDGLVVVMFNGSDDQSYAAYDLDGFSTDANGLFVLGNTGVNNAEITLPSNGLQNGADAVALYTGNESDFPNDTPLSTTNLLSALVYGTNDGDDTELLTGLNETIQYNDTESESIQRQADDSFLNAVPTPGSPNSSQSCDFTIENVDTICDNITSGQDTYTTTIQYSGGGNDTFTVISTEGSIDLSAGDPTTDAAGTITITGVTENVDFTVNISNTGVCDEDIEIFSPDCEPSIDLPIYEAFDYAANPDVTTVSDWENFSGSGNTIEVIEDNLTYSGISASSGNAITIEGGGDDIEREFTTVATGEVFASFMIKVDDLSSLTNNTQGGYFALFGNFDTRLWIRPVTDTTYDIAYTNGSSATVFTTTQYNTGDVVFIVMSYNTDNGELQAWVNPAETDFGGTAPTATLTDTDSSPGSINRFALRQDSTGETPLLTFDELRLGTTWDEVTPTTLSNTSFVENNFKLYPNPSKGETLKISSSFDTDYEVSIYNMLGKKVLAQTVKASAELNISNLQSGVYLVKLTQGNQSLTKKLIIQ